MGAVVVVLLVFVAVGIAAARWGADSREGRDWQPGGVPLLVSRGRGLGRAGRLRLRRFWADQIELQQRLDLLNRPWEEDFLHWSGGEHLHGRVAPPAHRRRYSTTASGWCPAAGRTRDGATRDRAAR